MNTIPQTGKWNEISSTLNGNFDLIAKRLVQYEGAVFNYKGIFSTIDELKSKLPYSSDESFAYVGSAAPYSVFLMKNGEWVDSGKKSDEFSSFDWTTIPQASETNNGLMSPSLVTEIKNSTKSIKQLDSNLSTLKKKVEDYKPIEIYGDVVNAADEEDITSDSNNLLKLKDRLPLNGMGYVILRKDKTLAEQLTQTNTIYEVRYDFNVGGETITFPTDSTVKFVGGSISNAAITIHEGVLVKDGVFLQHGRITLANKCALESCLFDGGHDWVLVNGDDVRIQKCSFKNGVQDDVEDNIFAYINTDYVSGVNLEISDCYFSGFAGEACKNVARHILIHDGCINFRVRNNTFDNIDTPYNDNDCIQVLSNTVDSSEVVNYPYAYASEFAPLYGVVEGNKFINIKEIKSLIKIQASNVNVLNNTISFMEDGKLYPAGDTAAIRVINVKNCIIQGNTITSQLNTRLFSLSYASDSLVQGNHFISNSADATVQSGFIRFYRTDNCTFDSNLVLTSNVWLFLWLNDNRNLKITANHFLLNNTTSIGIGDLPNYTTITDGVDYSVSFFNNHFSGYHNGTLLSIPKHSKVEWIDNDGFSAKVVIEQSVENSNVVIRNSELSQLMVTNDASTQQNIRLEGVKCTRTVVNYSSSLVIENPIVEASDVVELYDVGNTYVANPKFLAENKTYIKCLRGVCPVTVDAGMLDHSIVTGGSNADFNIANVTKRCANRRTDLFNTLEFNGTDAFGKSVIRRSGYSSQAPDATGLIDGTSFINYNAGVSFAKGGVWYDAIGFAIPKDIIPIRYGYNPPESDVAKYPSGWQFYDFTAYKPKFVRSGVFYDADGYKSSYARKGDSASRPILMSVDSGFVYFDTELGRPIWWTGRAWVDATGANV